MSADDNAPEQVREVGVVVDILLDDVGLALADRSRNLAGAQATLKAIATAERVIATLAPIREAERQEAARAAEDVALREAATIVRGWLEDPHGPDEGCSECELLWQVASSLDHRADGVTGRSGT